MAGACTSLSSGSTQSSCLTPVARNSVSLKMHEPVVKVMLRDGPANQHSHCFAHPSGIAQMLCARLMAANGWGLAGKNSRCWPDDTPVNQWVPWDRSTCIPELRTFDQCCSTGVGRCRSGGIRAWFLVKVWDTQRV